MYISIHDRETGRLVATVYVCHGCGTHGPRRRRDGLPARWQGVTEPSYDGRGTRRRSHVVNTYCPDCVRAGCTAHTVARTLRRVPRPAPKGEA